MQDQRNNQLFQALLNDNVQEVSLILQNDGNSRDNDSSLSDYELLCQAIKLNRRRVAHYLLDRGCCVSKPESTNNIPLHLAIERLSKGCDWTNIVSNLLDAGARASDINLNGDTAVHLAFLKGVEGDILDILVEAFLLESNKDVINNDEVSVLHAMCTRPELKFVVQLKNAFVNRRVPDRLRINVAGYSPLHIAVEYGNYEIAVFLLQHGADIYAQNSNNSTPLHLACYCRNSEMMDLILESDRHTANFTDNNGLSHFMVACSSKNPAFAEEHLRVANCKPSISEEILISSCTKNLADCQFAGYSPLHFSAEFDSREVFKLLMNRGADCCVMTGELFTPLMIAYNRGHEKFVRLFKRYCKGYQLLKDAVLVKKCIVDVDE